MAVFILIHGAWHGGWCWERVGPMLEAAGHRVLAPDLPGMGSDRTPFAPNVLAQWADFTADLIRAQDEPVILAGHSRGGVVISETAERVPERIRQLAYVTAFLLPSGMSLFENVASYGGKHGVRPVTDEASGTCTVEQENRRDAFCHLCPEADAEASMARLCPEPLAALGTPLAVTMERFGTVPRAYIEAAEDQVIALDHQRSMHAALPCNPVFTLKSDHSPFYSAPRELADALLALAG